MASLGSFGRRPTPEVVDGEVVEPEPLTFDYFGTEIRVDQRFTDADLTDFLEDADGLDESDSRALPMLKRLCRAAIHPDDFETFWALGKEHAQTLTDRSEVVWAVIAALADRPTRRSSDSSGGPSTVAPRSEDGSYSQVRSRLVGRPDLQLVVDQAQEAQGAVAV